MATRRSVQTTTDGVPLLKAMIYGVGGTGKTTLGFSFNADPRTGPALILNASGNPDWALREQPDAVVIDLEAYTDIDLPYEFLLAGQPAGHRFRKAYGISDDIVFKSLIIDTFSDWQIRMIDSITAGPKAGLSDARGPTLKERSPILSKTVKPARELMTTLDMHVVLLMQERTKINLEGGTETSVPWIDGGARELIPSWANFVGHTNNQLINKEIVPVLTWRSPSLTSLTKNQWVPTIPERGLAVPTATKLFDKAVSSLGGK